MIEIKYIGQCGFIIFDKSCSLAIDPVLNDLVDDIGKSIRKYPPAIQYDELEVDYILCTHDHIDHMAEETLTTVARKNDKTKFVVPKGCVKEVISWGINKDRVIALSDGETKDLIAGKLVITGISAAHPVHQIDENGYDHNLVYCVELDGKKIVHLGDTYLTERLESELRKLGHINVLFPPINGRDEEREAKGIIGNLSCEESANLANNLKVDLTIPTHFDMVEGNTADPSVFVDNLLMLNKDNNFWIPSLNETIKI